jgi:hypothetical protein
MNFLGRMFKVITMLPSIILGVEGLMTGLKGDQKQKTVIEFAGFALNLAESISSKDIVDNAMFQDGLKQANDGIVKMLNASVWYKK